MKSLAAAFVINLLFAETSGAQDSEKNLQELLPPQSAAGKGPRAVGAEDIAKANAAASTSQEPAWRSGIIESGLAPFPAALYKFENQWHEILNGAHVKVYAGSLGQEPSQGVIVIQSTSLDNRNTGVPQVLKVPTGVGPLRITAANGSLLTLRSPEGIELTLNAANGELSVK